MAPAFSQKTGARCDNQLVLVVRLLLTVRLGFTLRRRFGLRLGPGLGGGPLFTLRLRSRCFRTNSAVLLHIVMWLIFSIRPVHFVRTVLVRAVRRGHISILRPVAVHVVWRIYVPVFRAVRIWVARAILVRVVRAVHVSIFRRVRIVRGISVPFRRGHPSIFRLVGVHVVWAGFVAIGSPAVEVVVRLARASGVASAAVEILAISRLAARVSGRYRSTLKLARPCGGGDGRMAVILGGSQ